MSKTLLDVVQSILSDLNSDEVNSISDTVESLQVANIVKDAFDNLVVEQKVPSNKGRIQLTSSNDPSLPTHTYIPEGTLEIECVYYDGRDNPDCPVEYHELRYLEPKQFLHVVNSRKASDPNVEGIVDPTDTVIHVYNDRRPECYTTFNDDALIFDAYDKNLESTLVNEKFMVLAETMPVFKLEDTYKIPLDPQLTMLLLNESKSTASLLLKQTTHDKAEQNARRQRVRSQKAKGAIHTKKLPYPNYGRMR